MISHRLRNFIRESNAIEGIHRAPTDAEIEISEWFLRQTTISIPHLVEAVRIYQPDAVIRDKPGLDVFVGDHHPMPGGPQVVLELANILDSYVNGYPKTRAWLAHCEYEKLHPFTDGNGRSGRLLWLWCMKQRGELPRALQYGFLHLFYYQTLENVAS